MDIAQSKTISEAFSRRVKADADRVGFQFKKGGEWKSITFGEQYETVRRLSSGLMRIGVKKEDKVSILAQTSLQWGQFDMAILGCAAITVPIYPTNTPEDMKYIINHSEVTVLFVDEFKNLQKIAGIIQDCPLLKKIIVSFDVKPEEIPAGLELLSWQKLYDLGLDSEGKFDRAFDENLENAKPSDIFTICYTSGTTGLPKGVILTHSCMSSVMDDVQKVLFHNDITNHELLLSFLPMSHIFGKWESATPYYLGWTQAYAESIDALVGNLAEVRPTIWLSVPRIYEKVYTKIMSTVDEGSAVKKALFQWAVGVGRAHLEAVNKGKSPSFKVAAEYKLAKSLVFEKISARFGGRMKIAVSGSAPLAANIQEFMHIVGVPVYEGYGLTETCAPICVNVPDANKFGTVGKIFPEVLVRIADDGEILIKSEKNFKGYYKNPEATAEAIQNGWFYTGDIGTIDSDGFLRITDRKKDLIKTAGGKYIAPQKIENLSKSYSLLNQLMVYGDQKPYAVALVTLNQEMVMQYAKNHQMLFSEFAELIKKPEIIKLVDDTIQQLNAQLARYESIKKVHIMPKEFTVEDGELTPSLKVKRKFLSQKYKSELEAMYISEE
jgi:long-chain acyl-CoA synthetase